MLHKIFFLSLLLIGTIKCTQQAKGPVTDIQDVNKKFRKENGPEAWILEDEIYKEDDSAVEGEDKIKKYYKNGNGQLHNKNGPAVEVNGNTYWFYNGELHRENGPAISRVDGSEAYFEHDLLHRKGGPAIVYPNGDEEWFIFGKLHRENDLPAIIKENRETQVWYKNGKLHRLRGPAIMNKDGTEESWVKGVKSVCNKEEKDRKKLNRRRKR